MGRRGLGRQEILGRRHLGALSTRVRSGGCERRHHLSREGRRELSPRTRQCSREQLPPLHDRKWQAEHDCVRESHRAEARCLAYDSCRRRRPQDPGLPQRRDAARASGQDIRGRVGRPLDEGRFCHGVFRPRNHRNGRELTDGARPWRSRTEPKEAAMIEVYLQEASIRERHANAQRAAALYAVLRELEPRRASLWRDAIHRLSKAISCLRLKRHTEGTALQEGGHQVTEGDRMKWVTRERARVDRIACPWLISRFIDKEPTFLFVPENQLREVAERESATPYDIPGVELGHHGERCSFDAFLDKYKLEDRALQALALIVRGADTEARQLTPESPGLYALATGFKAMAKD